MEEDGSQKEDLKLPTEEDFADVFLLVFYVNVNMIWYQMVAKLKAEFASGKDLQVTVIAAMGLQKIVSFRESNY